MDENLAFQQLPNQHNTIEVINQNQEQQLEAAGREEEASCRICWDVEVEGARNPLLRPCHCAGSVAFIHFCCLEQWIEISRRRKCPNCRGAYKGIQLIDVPSLKSTASLIFFAIGLQPPRILAWALFVALLMVRCCLFSISHGNHSLAILCLVYATTLDLLIGVLLVVRYRQWKKQDGCFFGRIFRVQD